MSPTGEPASSALAPADVRRAVEQLRVGRLVAVATESYFALMGDALDPNTLNQLFTLKGRDAFKGVALMVGHPDTWRSLVSSTGPVAERLAERFWPGPLTIVSPARSGLDPRIVVDGCVGVRIAGPSPAAAVVEAFGGPVTATSANLAGEPPCRSAVQVSNAFPVAVESGELLGLGPDAPGGAPSTLVRIDGNGFAILRSGAVTLDALSQALGPH